MPHATARLLLRAAACLAALGAPLAAQAAVQGATAELDATLRARLDWWSLQPLRIVDLAQLPGSSATAPIDRFVARELAAHELTAAPRAEPAVLLRRLSFALRGLPPTAAELAAFARDPSDAAYAQVVDAWLASPQYGERWARHWMDWLRYADSHGSEGDAAIPYAWRYRDYLIRAFDQDVPYDQLVREALAGDLLPQPRVDAANGRNESTIGTAHLRMVFHGYAPTDALAERVRFTDDQIDVVGKAFLGLTVSCARCHDHKFDPIAQRDYTALYGVFATCAPAVLDASVIDAAQQRLRDQLDGQQRELRRAIAAHWLASADELAARLAAPDAELQAAILRAKEPSDLLHPFAQLRDGHAPPLQTWRTHRAAAEPDAHAAWDLARDDELAHWQRSGPGVQHAARAGAFGLADAADTVLRGIYPAGTYSQLATTQDRGVLLSPRTSLDQKYDLWLQVAGDGGAAVRPVVQDYPRDGSVFPITSLDGGGWRWIKFDLGYWTGDEVHVELATAADQPVLARTDALRSWFGVRRVRLVPRGTTAPADDLAFAQPVLAACSEREPGDASALARAFADALRTAAAAWRDDAATDAQALYLDALLRAGLLANRTEQLPQTATALAECRRLAAALRAPERVPGVLEHDARDAPLFVRGDHKQPGAPVPRRSLALFGGAPCSPTASGRAELAQDWTRADHPLAARVLVNRVWQQLFGRGLVPTSDNFGHLGAAPSHPELLDWLARDFMARGWSIKTLIRTIVLSSTWRQDSAPSPLAQQRDPDDVWLSHFAVRRLDAEAIRDALLALAGDLRSDRHGPPVSGDEPRRSIYVRQKRNEPDPLLAAFDAPVPASCKGQRDATNVPAQALTLLNDPFVWTAAEHAAARAEQDASLRDPAARVQALWLAALGRAPSDAERQRALAFVQRSDAARAEASTARERLDAAIAAQQQQLDALDAAIAARALAARAAADAPPRPAPPQPFAAWSFERDTDDDQHRLAATPHGHAAIQGGALVLDGDSSYLATAPLPCELRSKTLTATVQLDDLAQQGGGVISVQTLDGVTFDALVFGEQQRGRWLAGSDLFHRTRSFDGPDEDAARARPVQLALVYAADGTITAYRDGVPYGASYRSDGPVVFAAGKAQVLFGCRHGEPGGNKLLRGRIHAAALYDRALTADEIAALANAGPSAAELARATTAAEQQQRTELQTSLTDARAALQQLSALPGASSGWADLAHALCNLKEFVYLR